MQLSSWAGGQAEAVEMPAPPPPTGNAKVTPQICNKKNRAVATNTVCAHHGERDRLSPLRDTMDKVNCVE